MKRNKNFINNPQINTPNKINKIIQRFNQNKNLNLEPDNVSKSEKISNIQEYSFNNDKLKPYEVISTNENKYSNEEINVLKTNNNLNNLNTSKNNINVYNKKKVNNYLTSLSVTSSKNSYISNNYTNFDNNNNNIKNKEFNPYVCYTDYPIKNNNNIKKYTYNNKSPNILIQNIYEADDYFNQNIKEGLLYLKDFEVMKSNKLSFIDIHNEEIRKKNKKDITKTLSRFLIKPKNNNQFSFSDTKINKHYENTKSYDYKKNINKELDNGYKRERELSEQPKRIIRRSIKHGKISNILNYFNNKVNFSDIIMIRGMRNEKGGVVDFTTASPKKKSKINNYIINNSIINKNIYKYPNYKIIFSVKIIQKRVEEKNFII